MIDIRVEPGKRLTIKGHAGYAMQGHDIVCAAVSSLYCTMIMADGITGVKDEDGSMIAQVMRPQAAETFRVFCDGMKKIAEQYPTYVSYKRAQTEL